MLNVETKIIIGASAYASIKYAGTFGQFPYDAHHCGTVDMKLAPGCSASSSLMRIASEHRERAARELRYAAIAEAAATKLKVGA